MKGSFCVSVVGAETPAGSLEQQHNKKRVGAKHDDKLAAPSFHVQVKGPVFRQIPFDRFQR